MRRFELYIDKMVVGKEPTTKVLEFDDSYTDQAIEDECREVLEEMVWSEVDSGWNEI